MKKRDPKARMQEMTAKLRERGGRLTPQRLALLELIAAGDGHPNAEQLYAKIKGRFPTMSFASVYKTLNLLKELAQVQEIDLRDDSRYDGNRPEPHPHIVCTRCRKIVDGDFEMPPEEIRRMERASGYRIVRPQILFYGLCPACRRSGP